MNQLLIDRLRDARKSKQLKQTEVVEIAGLNLSPNSLSGYENGVTEPSIDTFFKLCRFYEIDDYAALLAEAYNLKRNTLDLSFSEYESMRKYQELDSHGKKIVDFILQEEYERSVVNKLTEKQ